MAATIETVMSAFLAQRQDMQLCTDLMGGTQAMLEAGKTYIPQEKGEDAESYQLRLNRTILFNVYKRTLRYLCGRVFEKPVVLGEDATDQRFLDFTENVDRMGHNLTIWSRKVFESGLNDGVTFCLVDFANPKTRTENGVLQYQKQDGTWADKTESADRDNDWGPYFIHVPVKLVLGARLEWFGSKPKITHFRYMETVEYPDGMWGTKTYQRIKVFFVSPEDGRVYYQIWSNLTENNTTGAFELKYESVLSIDVIPVAVFMPGEKQTVLTAEPALIDLAQLNKRHWQATSSQYELMEYVRRPPWFGKCLGEFDEKSGKTKVIFGAGKLCHSQNENASLMSIGVDSGSVAAGRQELQDLEDRMAIYGLQLLQPKTAAITATESLRDSEENNSTLKAWALQFQDFLENCMQLVGLWWNLPDGPSVVVNTDFANAVDAAILLDMFRAQVISGETLLSLYKNMGILPDDFNVEDEAVKLANGLMINGTGANSLADIMKNTGL